MTVNELIYELKKIGDKDKNVFIHAYTENSDEFLSVDIVEEDNHNDVILKQVYP